MKTSLRLAAHPIVLIAAIGCSSGMEADDVQSVETGIVSTLDQRFSAVAARAPAFGGMFYDAQGQLSVYLTEGAQREVALAAVARVFPESVTADVQVLEGRFGFEQLAAWRASAKDVLALDGVVFTDVDEAINRLTIGVSTSAAIAAVEQELAALRIPSEAVHIQMTDPIVPVTTLRDKVRPVQAGVQIHFGGYLCSLGFNATRASVAGFVTASHCTNKQGGVEGTLYYQPLSSVADSFLGTETADPLYTRNSPGCPKGKKCRSSDAAFAALDANATSALGAISQTTGVNNGSLTYAEDEFGNILSFSIAAEGPGAVGQAANKVGRTTGWTQGQITNTCVDTGVSGSSIVQLCQDWVSAGVGGGDSGSGTFRLEADGTATLLGILWGGNQAGTLFVYSPISNVESELGALATF